MRFAVRRTSEWDDDVMPCEEANLHPIYIYTYFTFKTIREANQMYPDFEFEKTKGGRIRHARGEADRWCVDFDTLAELDEFIGKYGPVVITTLWENPEMRSIEIYDDYRE